MNCAHGGTGRRMCPHQVDVDDPPDFYVRFTGRGGEHLLLCLDCSKLPEPPLVDVCAPCFDGRSASILSASGLQGRPGIRARASGLAFVHRKVDVEIPPLHALAPLADGPRSTWLGVGADGVLRRIELDVLRAAPVASVDLVPPLRIETSADGRFAAVVESRGGRGRVYDLASSRLTLRLVRGDYRLEHCEFPAAFFHDGERTLLVHGSDWNRLDISDPATGEVLTPRELGEAHALDYFHGRLSVSPDGRWLIDDGWIWHPVGALRRIDLRRWRRENVWESEDGPSVLDLRQVSYFWDGPSCFIDEGTFALWGFGWDAEVMADAALIVDVERGRARGWFAGPPGGAFSFDRHLVVSTLKDGATVWDVDTGERLLHDPAFGLSVHHPRARRWARSRDGGGMIETRLRERSGS
jgi:hypothetical protein